MERRLRVPPSINPTGDAAKVAVQQSDLADEIDRVRELILEYQHSAPRWLSHLQEYLAGYSGQIEPPPCPQPVTKPLPLASRSMFAASAEDVGAAGPTEEQAPCELVPVDEPLGRAPETLSACADVSDQLPDCNDAPAGAGEQPGAADTADQAIHTHDEPLASADVHRTVICSADPTPSGDAPASLDNSSVAVENALSIQSGGEPDSEGCRPVAIEDSAASSSSSKQNGPFEEPGQPDQSSSTGSHLESCSDITPPDSTPAPAERSSDPSDNQTAGNTDDVQAFLDAYMKDLLARSQQLQKQPALPASDDAKVQNASVPESSPEATLAPARSANIPPVDPAEAQTLQKHDDRKSQLWQRVRRRRNSRQVEIEEVVDTPSPHSVQTREADHRRRLLFPAILSATLAVALWCLLVRFGLV